MKRVPCLLLLPLILLTAACAAPPEPPTATPETSFLPLELQMRPTPTPLAPAATPLPLELQAVVSGDPVVNPVSDLVPAVDPEIAFLIDAVSEQNLMGYVQKLESFGTRNTFSDTERDDFGIGAARRWIFSEFQRVGGDRLDVQFQDYSFTFNGVDTTQRNIIATLPGTGKYPGTLVLMANYDSRAADWMDGRSMAPGADDNGSGIAGLLEIARLMSARTWDQTVIFAALTAEEQGTYGSRHFVEQAFLNNIQIEAAINNDMIGGRAGIPQSVRLYSIGPDTSNARQLARYIDHVSGLYLPSFAIQMIEGLDREDRWGDQREFVSAGYPAVRLIESEEDLSIQNSTRDTWSLIDYSYFRKIVQLNLASLANMACAPRPSAIAEPLADPGTFLVAWVPDANVAGYAISVRPLGSERFAPFRFVSAEQAGNVVLSGYESETGYAISLAAMNDRGCLGAFSSPEIIIPPSR
ncbi:MAG: M20/M25/M40 family metallo-hydrolase [Candidatus Promineifilaceae bacterium]